MDIEALLIPWLTAAAGARAVTDLPAELLDVLPIIQLARIGGADDDNDPSFDAPTVSIDCYATDRSAALGLALDVKTLIRTALPGTTLGGASTVTKAQTLAGPAWRPYGDTTLRRVGATYRLHVKTRSS